MPTRINGGTPIQFKGHSIFSTRPFGQSRVPGNI
ncbi:hypothetical protein SLEP1_g15858 [Rubroshorea leprosula]|uniref:Uncharacterized protein n=1 Tax=Rubroshorea leprosula TaxID=152421 RepID=A0AAV5IZB5_9ROSI|nr:hypothetical protein SLEP1_g15858 [Rubroshorea leprosula]